MSNPYQGMCDNDDRRLLGVERGERGHDAILAQQEKVSQLRGLCGRYRAAIRDALEQIPEGTNGRSILERALEDKADGR